MNNNFKKAREAKKFTQEFVAQKLGVTRTTYIRYENGERECSFESLLKLSKIFDASIDSLLGNTPEQHEFLDEEQKQLLNVFHDLSPDNRATVFKISQSLQTQQSKTEESTSDKKGKSLTFQTIGTHHHPFKIHG